MVFLICSMENTTVTNRCSVFQMQKVNSLGSAVGCMKTTAIIHSAISTTTPTNSKVIHLKTLLYQDGKVGAAYNWPWASTLLDICPF